MAYTLNDTSISITVDDSEYNRCMNSLSQTAEKTFQTIAGLAANSFSSAPLGFQGNFQAAFTELRAVVETLGEQLTSGIQPGIDALNEMLETMQESGDGILQLESSIKSLSDSFLQLQNSSGVFASTVNSNLIGQFMSIGTVSGQGANALKAMASGFESLSATAGTVVGALGPVGIAMLAFSALSAISDWIGSDLDRLSQKAKALAEEAQRTRDALSEGNKKRDTDQDKIDTIQKLSEYDSLNDSEREAAIKLNQDLANSYGVQVMTIDEATKRLKINAEALKEVNRQMAERKRLENKENVIAAQRSLESAKAEFVAKNRSSLTKSGAAGFRSGSGVRGMNEGLLKRLSNSPKELELYLKSVQKPEERQVVLDLIDAYKKLHEAQSKANGTDEDSKKQEAARLLREGTEKRKAMDSLNNTKYNIAFNEASSDQKEQMLKDKINNSRQKQRESFQARGYTDIENKDGYNAYELELEREMEEDGKKLRDFAKERANILRSLEQDESNYDYQNSSATEKKSILEKQQKELQKELDESINPRLDEEIKDLQAQNDMSFRRRGLKEKPLLADMTPEERARENQALSLQQQRAGIIPVDVKWLTQKDLGIRRELFVNKQKQTELQKAADERTKQINQQDAEYEQQKKKQKAQKSLDWKIDNLKDQGKTGAARTLIESEYAKAKKEAAASRKYYEDLKRDSAGKVLDENKAKELEKAGAKAKEADSNEEHWKDRVQSEQQDSEKALRDSRKASIAFSSEVLSGMIGDKTPEKETAKNTKAIAKHSEEASKKLDKIASGEVLG